MPLNIISVPHFAVAFILFIIWALIVIKKDHVLGCPGAPAILYHKSLHLFMLAGYMAAHTAMLGAVQQMDQPTEFAYSKMGKILLVLRRMHLFLVFRACVISLWLILVFYENAEETYLPVAVLGVHLVLSVTTILHIISAVKADNDTLDERDRMYLDREFYGAAFIEVVIAITWFMFNVADVAYCHKYYGG